ncbi:Hypothetical protein EMIHUDRAFT_454428 [Emiliania huxleyi CCMP1516]|uniref:DNA mismatch repair proteins mutS family domain-containing protein n=2 Tax=Emiliania huxleyi TaxID=2903 RepID=A0A0D3KUC1_EMIH1|nr:Hypothetical protein EMIHUDRAFT_454428 [Emiliania huxleyi CCMP1516]EOD39356.1 Hypothetical protein EMIHUDRAFT_454428 [Emiliania huxleyi CCMP1516]|eukprot:XP_005791785.1 Hypothetical protein EMIHUDRAFT_454428 [Emiliania huxleyi CCMP1516]
MPRRPGCHFEATAAKFPKRYMLALSVCCASLSLPSALTLSSAFTRDAVALGLPECLQLLSDRAQTAPGRALCLTPRLHETAAECRDAYSAVSEAFAVESSPPFPHELAIEDSLVAVSAGATLGPQDLLEIGQAVAALHTTACWAEPHRWERTPQLAALAINASPPPRLLKAFGDAFDRTSTGEAFPRLARRRVAAQSAARSTADKMRSLLTEPDFVAGLAEDRPPPRQRDGRWVVPVAVGSGQGRVGEEVARSRSGATAFVEPHRVRALSALVAAHRASLEESLAAAGELDAVFARAALGAAWGARVPAVGGKSVALKTVGLAALLASSPRVDFFSAVVSDLAEAQDVSAGTSSYAAHAVIEELLARGARLVATTHASPLKLLALRDTRLQVGCGAEPLELLGQTLDALSLLEIDAAEARAKALGRLGLRALDGRPLRAGESLAEVAEDAPEGSADAQMSIVGGPPVRVPRAELAEWAAVDAATGLDSGSFSADGWDWMGAVAPTAEQSRSSGGGKRQRRR